MTTVAARVAEEMNVKLGHEVWVGESAEKNGIEEGELR